MIGLPSRTRMRCWIAASALTLSGCGEAGAPAVRPAGYVPLPSAAPASVTAVKGQTAPHLIAQFGEPQLDVSEGPARKLQFAGPICVLDAYLYPATGRGEPVVTYLDTRQRDGGPIDQASCLAALTRR
jgi:hypothetical protein